jgi:hypothetical protein
MARTLQDKLKGLPKKRQTKIQKRANELIAEEMTLRELRCALNITQNDLTIPLDIQQDGISRLERRSDLLLSTLRKYIQAMGGTLKLTAEFPNRPPVVLTGFGDIDDGVIIK